MVRRGYRGATISEALTAPPGERVLAVTFDDAHRSVLELAAPIMARLGVPGTVYVPTDYAGTERPMGWEGYDVWLGTEHERELLCMGWEDLRGLVAGGWEVGSHTCSHPRLARIDDAAIAAELSESKRICAERIGAPCESLAYPYSDYDTRAVRAAWEAGYRSAVTVPTSPASPLPLEWPRIGVYRGESVRRLSARLRTRRLRPSGAARAALALRRLAR
jgi:peptidoglycan/xylan/chitin deacetylase (PgdA/CDA1 family)